MVISKKSKTDRPHPLEKGDHEIMPRRVLTGLLCVTAAGSLTLAFAGPAMADDAHQTCTNTVACTGNILDVHDITTTLHDVTLHLRG